jgi:hypothetical protein
MGGYVRYARRTNAAKPVKRNTQKQFHKKALVFTTALPPRRFDYVMHLYINHKRTLESMRTLHQHSLVWRGSARRLTLPVTVAPLTLPDVPLNADLG